MSEMPELPQGQEWRYIDSLKRYESKPKQQCPHCGEFAYFGIYKPALIFADTEIWGCENCGYES
jgi:predicted RNA-binding Zn-ribbon protein involved in translation (DUF1610 family)